MDNSENSKKISICGTNNKYQMNKILNKNNLPKEQKKRVVTEKWCFTDEYYAYENQIKLITTLQNKTNEEKQKNEEILNVIKIIIQEINKKISGYKQQDIIKKKLNIEKFITFESVIDKMMDCQLKCRYCNENMNVLYDLKREMKQWSVDRIDNDNGHNYDNFHLACLDCNLKRRRRTDEKFLFTKQLNIIKQENTLL
jgi:hypothetical protein